MIPFLVAGVLGSSLLVLLSIYTFLINTGIFDWGYFILGIISGFLAGITGYLLFKLGGFIASRLFKYSKPLPKWVKAVFYVITAIFGLVFYQFIYMFLLF